MEDKIPLRTFDKFLVLNLDNNTKKTLDQIFESTIPNRVSKNLRRLLLSYLESYHTNLPIDFDEILFDLDQLFQLLDIANDIKMNN